MSDVDEEIRELTTVRVPIYTVEGVFDKRHLADPSVMPTFWDDEVPDFRLECDGSVTVDPSDVEVIEGVPEGMCDHCENGVAMAFLRGRGGPLD